MRGSQAPARARPAASSSSRDGTDEIEFEVRLEGALARLNSSDRSKVEAWVQYVEGQGDEDGDDRAPEFCWDKAFRDKTNRRANRYGNIASWDHALLPGPYLNASLIPGLASADPVAAPDLGHVQGQGQGQGPAPPSSNTNISAQTYIASQAPLPHTFPAFLSHLCNHGVRVLVMLTPLAEQGRAKADAYWPTSTSAPSSAHALQSVLSRLQKRLHTGPPPHADAASGTVNDEPGRAQARGSLQIDGSAWAVDLLEETQLRSGPPFNVAGQDAAHGPTPRRLPDGTVLHLRHLRLRSGSPGTSDKSAGAPSSAPGEKHHDLVQLHLSSWADFGGDSLDTLDILLDWIDHLQHPTASSRSTSASDLGQQKSDAAIPPLWVHCSAGVGRSGTVIAAHMIRHAKFTSASFRSFPTTQLPHLPSRAYLLGDTVDADNAAADNDGDDERSYVLARAIALVAYLRSYRPTMVQSSSQLKMVYETMLTAKRQLEHR